MLLVVLATLLGPGCGSNPVKDGGSASSATAEGSATFSCDLDGVSITGSGIDEMQQRNTAFIYPVPVTGDHIMFTLASTKDGSDPKPDYSIRIYCPRKQGSFVITDADDESDTP